MSLITGIAGAIRLLSFSPLFFLARYPLSLHTEKIVRVFFIRTRRHSIFFFSVRIFPAYSQGQGVATECLVCRYSTKARDTQVN